jgi:hypothetical protein
MTPKDLFLNPKPKTRLDDLIPIIASILIVVINKYHVINFLVLR